MKNNLIIINSDDFGASESVNKAIVSCFEKGFITSTTLMANGEGFEDAINYTHSNSILKNKVGLHLNLTAGRPLTDDIKKCSRFCDKDGDFIYDRKKPFSFLTASEQVALYSEIKAQISKLINYDIFSTHIDSHHHIHTEAMIIRVYTEVAKEFGIKKMRIAKNIGDANIIKKMYKNIFNFYLQRIKKISTTNFFCTANEFRDLMNKNLVREDFSYEIMVHAKINTNGVLTDIDNCEMDGKIKPILSNFKPVSYYEMND